MFREYLLLCYSNNYISKYYIFTTYTYVTVKRRPNDTMGWVLCR